MNTHRYTDPAPAAPVTVSTTEPLRASRVESEVIVPMLQTLFTLTLVVADVLLWQWRPLAGALGLVGLLVWSWRIVRSDALMWRLERITGQELTGDGIVGKPGVLALLNPDQARRDVANLAPGPASDVPRMAEFVTRCIFEGTSEAAQSIRPNTADRANYVECRDALMRLGLARWRNADNRSAGWDMTTDIEKALEIIEKHVA